MDKGKIKAMATKFSEKFAISIDFCRLKIQFVELDFSNLIFQKSRTDQQGVGHAREWAMIPGFFLDVKLQELHKLKELCCNEKFLDQVLIIQF